MTPPNPALLYLDDDLPNLEVFGTLFRRHKVVTATNIRDALQKLDASAFSVVVSDYRFQNGNGLDFLKIVSERFPNIPRILTSAYGDRELVVKSLNEFGVFAYLPKPWDIQETKRTIENAIKAYNLKETNDELLSNLSKTILELKEANAKVDKLSRRLLKENIYLKHEVDLAKGPIDLIGNGQAMQVVKQKIEQVAQLDIPVLITGETGTGKDLVARNLHAQSRRKDEPFITVNCSALPGTLIESELFGFEKGAFTGAQVNKPGLFELANGGTIFLDEIGEMPIEFQPKLLHVLQSGQFFRVGGIKVIDIDVRIIAATNRKLQEAITEKKFRSDLFYRLNIFPISVPPLRERKEDFEELVKHFLAKSRKKIGKEISEVPDRVLKILTNHIWPGNVRELEGVIERSVVMSSNGKLELFEFHDSEDRPLTQEYSSSLPPSDLSFKEMQRRYLLNVLQDANWKISGRGGAAERLQMNQHTLRALLERLNIDFRRRG